MKTKPDFMLVLLAVFGIGVAITFIVPSSAESSLDAPASQLQAGIILTE